VGNNKFGATPQRGSVEADYSRSVRVLDARTTEQRTEKG